MVVQGKDFVLFFSCKFPEMWIVAFFVSILPSYTFVEEFSNTDPITAVT